MANGSSAFTMRPYLTFEPNTFTGSIDMRIDIAFLSHSRGYFCFVSSSVKRMSM